MKKLLALFVILWAGWFFCFRYYLIWLEGYSYFSTLPDFISTFKTLPGGFTAYIGAFLHQFYSVPAVGAAIQSLLDIWVVFCTGVIITRLFRNPKRLLWMALIPLPFVLYGQFWDLYMVVTLRYFFIFGGLMLAVVMFTSVRHVELRFPDLFRNKYVAVSAAIVLTIISVYVLAGVDPAKRVHEERARLEYLGNQQDWDKILEVVSPQDSRRDEFKRRYVLLALSEKGLLTEYAFRYGLSGSDDFIFRDSIEPMALNFNCLFYQCMGMHNAAIHQAYQLGVQSLSGIGFSSLRRLADIYLELEDHELAKKYLDIISHSSCHKAWVRERMHRLESIKGADPEYGQELFEATIADFPHTISSMVDGNRDNRQYADLLLCSLLADEEGDKFKNIFGYVAQVQYPSGTGIPRLYEEAIILISMVDPQIMREYAVSDEVRSRFADYVGMMNTGKGTQALRKYSDTYWAYSY